MGTSTIPSSTLDSSSTAGSTATPAPASTSTTPNAPVVQTPGPASTPSTGTMPAALPIALNVSFTLNTPDGLRQISFGLEKDTACITTDWTQMCWRRYKVH